MEEETKKLRFHNKVWNSISKIEKYPDMAAEGLKTALKYLVKIVAVLTVLVCLGIVYQTNNLIHKGVDYLKNEFPEFSYKDGKLEVLADSEIKTSVGEKYIGKVIVDAKTEEESIINKYINEITGEGEGIIILKDRIIIKNSAVVGTISYMYKDAFEQMGIKEFSKQDVIDYANSSQILTLYLSIFLTIFIYSFIMYFLTTISNVVLLSIFGYITTLLARIKIRYVAIFNMSIYAITLSVILNMLYIGINIFVPFSMEYFQVMYIAVAAIYLVAAILILKTEFIKKQMELMKIQEAEKIIKKELEEDKEQEEKNKKQEDKKDDKKEEKNEENKKTNQETKDGEKKKEEKQPETKNEVKKGSKTKKETVKDTKKEKTKSKTNSKKKENEKEEKQEENKKRGTTKKTKTPKKKQVENPNVEPEGSEA